MRSAVGGRSTRLLRGLAVTAAVAVLVGGGLETISVAMATTPTTTYYACLGVGGVLYNVNTAAPPKCKAKDQQISWNQTGPAGTNGVNGRTS